MNSWGLNCLEVDITVANPQRRRGLDLDLDLNYPLPPQMRALDLSLGLSSYNNSSQQVQVQAQVHGWSLSHHHQVTNAASEVLDDDEVAIISPRTFAQSREISEGNHSHGKRGVLREATGTPRGRLAAAILCTNCKTRMPDDCQPCLKPGTSNKKKCFHDSTVAPVCLFS
ncbi:conserved hypothetical protein [Ricinus communis]|uniref:Uncharacterized protein n=1 Tax=Ricinus communis TaxID=3988 RepID=B9RWC3_RICCO|nr:conserved hypothetical protein [Ricinus communis]